MKEGAPARAANMTTIRCLCVCWRSSRGSEAWGPPPAFSPRSLPDDLDGIDQDGMTHFFLHGVRPPNSFWDDPERCWDDQAANPSVSTAEPTDSALPVVVDILNARR